MTDTVTLADCPIGLFLSENNQLCLKTEYGSNEGRIDAYIVSSGEFFWGKSPQTIPNQRKQLVRPVDVDVHVLNRCPTCKGDGDGGSISEFCETCDGRDLAVLCDLSADHFAVWFFERYEQKHGEEFHGYSPSIP